MFKSLRFILFLFVILLQITDTIAQKHDSTWVLKKNKNDIELYARFPEESRFKEVKATCVFAAQISDLVKIVLDVESYPDWVSNIKEGGTLKKVGEHEYINYYIADFPWPLKDRDVVLNTILVQEEDSKSVYIELEGRATFIAEKKDIIRIQNIHAYWYFIPEHSGMVKVSYQMLVDPGGKIPVWLINKFLIEGPYQNLYRLRELMEEKGK